MTLDDIIVLLPAASNPATAIPVDSPSPAVDPCIMHPVPTPPHLHRSTRTVMPHDRYEYGTP